MSQSTKHLLNNVVRIAGSAVSKYPSLSPHKSELRHCIMYIAVKEGGFTNKAISKILRVMHIFMNGDSARAFHMLEAEGEKLKKDAEEAGQKLIEAAKLLRLPEDFFYKTSWFADDRVKRIAEGVHELDSAASLIDCYHIAAMTLQPIKYEEGAIKYIENPAAQEYISNEAKDLGKHGGASGDALASGKMVVDLIDELPVEIIPKADAFVAKLVLNVLGTGDYESLKKQAEMYRSKTGRTAIKPVPEIAADNPSDTPSIQEKIDQRIAEILNNTKK